MSDKQLMIIFFIIGLIILLEQYFNYGKFFEVTDIHHETFAIGFFCISLGIYFVSK